MAPDLGPGVAGCLLLQYGLAPHRIAALTTGDILRHPWHGNQAYGIYAYADGRVITRVSGNYQNEHWHFG
ncbi:hypothetical protein ACSDR0_47525 [Streptosporangium sp. G11]|uniref:hypothetical protein n=1 Tax=Streptosporangium sp. G11 TaxID=3436926 RepID=UPI003EB9C9FA